MTSKWSPTYFGCIQKGGGDTVFSVGSLISGEELKPSKDKKKV